MNPFRGIEDLIDRWISDRFRGSGSEQEAGGRRLELIEMHHRILELIDRRVQNLPRARRAFPFNDVLVRIPAPEGEDRAAYEAVFTADDLTREAIARLDRDRVEHPRDLAVRVELLPISAGTEPLLTCDLRKPADSGPSRRADENRPVSTEIQFISEGLPTVRLGTKARILIGRQREVLDKTGRLVRRNDLALSDDSVSRAHAHIAWDAVSGDFRLFDDGSSHGTSVLHEGELTNVPAGSSRGQRICPGDELYFGRVRVRFEVSSAE